MADKDICSISSKEADGYKYLFNGSVDGERLHRQNLFGFHRCECVDVRNDKEAQYTLTH
jgi:hypothetical protein